MVILDYKMEDNFDPAFYLNIYPDVLRSHAAAYIHYKRFGKAEGRTPNRFELSERYKTNLAFGINQINPPYRQQKENLINVVIRTHLREHFFKKAIQSIINQKYSNSNQTYPNSLTSSLTH